MRRGVVSRGGAVASLLAMLALPFVARPSRAPPPPRATARRWSIITPHNEAIRHEFTARLHARSWRARAGACRSTGAARAAAARSTACLAADYAASFERYWTRDAGRPWSGHVARRLRAPIRPPGAAVDPEAADARRAFLASDVGCGIDLLFGGGSADAASTRAPDAWSTRAWCGRTPSCSAPPPSPPSWAARRSGIATGAGWARACRASASASTATRWRGWASTGRRPRGARSPIRAYFGSSGSPIRGKSGSAVKTFEMIIQEQMQQALERRAEARGRRRRRRWTTSRCTRAGGRPCA